MHSCILITEIIENITKEKGSHVRTKWKLKTVFSVIAYSRREVTEGAVYLMDIEVVFKLEFIDNIG